MKIEIEWLKILKLAILWLFAYGCSKCFLYFYPDPSLEILGLSIKTEAILESFKILLIAHSINIVKRVLVWDFLMQKIFLIKVPFIIIQITSMMIYFVSIIFIANKISSQSVVALLTALGGLGVIIGFGIQRLVLDAFSGISLNVDSAFKLGDYISVKIGSNSFSGNVTKVSWRIVTLLDESGWYIMIPNNVISGNTVINYSSAGAISELEASYHFSPRENHKFVTEILTNAFQAVAAKGYILKDPKPIFRCSSITHNNGMKFVIYYYAENAYTVPPKVSPSKMKSFVNMTVLNHINASGIQFYDSNIFTPDNNTLENGNDEYTLRKNLLKNIHIFNDLKEEEKEHLLKNMLVHSYAPNTDIIKQGDEGDSMFILRQGFCTVHVKDNNHQDTIVAVIDPGDFFGEMSLLIGDKRRATIISETNVIVYEVKKDHIIDILNKNNELHLSFANYIVKRMSETEQHLNSIAHKRESHQNLLDKYISKMRAFFSK